MKSVAKSILGGVAATFVAGAAFAADVPDMIVPVVQPVVVPAPAPGFSFAGVYAGIAGGAFFSTPAGFTYENIDLQAQAGFNLVRGRLLVGVEGRALAIVASGAPFAVELGADIRAGLLLGDRAVVYAKGGAATYLPGGGLNYEAGGGVEVAIGQRLSLFAETLAYFQPGFGFFGLDFRAGLNLHFGH